MAAGLTVRDSNLFKPVLVEAIAARFATQTALMDTGVMTLVPNFPARNASGNKWVPGSTIEVPYFSSLGELEDITEGQALTPRQLTSSLETATVIHSGIAAEVTDWAQMASQAGDPYEQLAAQFVEAARRKLDSGGIAAALLTPLVYDTSGASLTADHIVYASELWGDQMDDSDGVRLIVVHSRVRRALRLLKNLNGLPLYADATMGPNGRPVTLPMFAGIPVKTSDRLAPTGNVYPSLILKRNALVGWYNGDPMPEEDRDILSASDITALHMYHAEHLYRKASPDGIKPGAIKITSTEPAV